MISFDLSALAGMELVVRRLQLIEESKELVKPRRMRVRSSLLVIEERELWWRLNWADTSPTNSKRRSA